MGGARTGEVLAGLDVPLRRSGWILVRSAASRHDGLLHRDSSQRDVLAVFPSIPARLLLSLVCGSILVLSPRAWAQSYVALMDGQRAVPLKGRFNQVPVLHSNQPEEVEGPGILISTVPGTAIAAENGIPVEMPAYTFNGEFGLHLHHKYFPTYRRSISASQRRGELTLATILVNPKAEPVRIQFSAGAVRNSFEAPYLAQHLMGVRPLGPRPWNTGPGDATAVQLLRGRLDSQFKDTVILPPKGRVVLFHTPLPALGIANALLKGRSDGPFQIVVLAAKNPQSDADLFAVMDQGRLAPGRVYLHRIPEIHAGTIFSRVGGVAIGDHYQSSLSHDLSLQGPLHVPLTSTRRTHFGTGEVQVNPLATRVADSALDNVGTYGVRFDVDLSLVGQGSYDIVLSHPSPVAGRAHFTAFRGSIEIRRPEGVQSVHVGLRSGQSLSLAPLQLERGRSTPVRISLVYPADSTPGHLLSIVPTTQLTEVQQRERRQPVATDKPAVHRSPQMPAASPRKQPARQRVVSPILPPAEILRYPNTPNQTPPSPARPSPQPQRSPGGGLADRYKDALDVQRRLLEQWHLSP